MDDFRSLVHDPKHREAFEKLLRLAARKGDADIVAERLSWGIDPNCATPKGRTPLMINVHGFCPSAATVRALLSAGADPKRVDESGLSALDYARRKLSRMQLHGARPPRTSPSLDENNQLRLPRWEQQQMDKMRKKLGGGEEAREFMRIWWQERLRAARRRFNDPREVERIVELLEKAVAAG